MLYSKKWIFTFILTSWSAKLPYTEQSSDYRQHSTKYGENLKKYCEFAFSRRSELTVWMWRKEKCISVLSYLRLVPIHTHLETSHLKHSSCSVMIKVIQLNSYIIVVVKGNPKYPLYKSVLEYCKSSCNEDLTAFWKKRAIFKVDKCQFHQQYFSL